MKLNAKQRFVITGTPVENSITDLWSQINFLNPGLLGNYNFFSKKYVVSIEKDKDENATKILRNIVKPFILRRTKKQVATDLPLKTEQIRLCDMTEEQGERYESVKSLFRNELMASISNVGMNNSKLMILQGLTKLRQIANHPILAQEDYLDGSGKFNEVIEMVQKAIENKHKILLFSQFVQHLNLYKEYFKMQNQSFLYLDGSTPSAERSKLVNEFQKDKDIPLFLISLKAGGVGLNLTSADYVFLLDPWWNPAVEKQAMDRTHRIGQTKPVFVYKFISKNTIEEKIIKLQEKKQRVSDDLIEQNDAIVKNIVQNDLEELLN
jgi:SNF2 family DNA or RNA helicase